MNIIKKTIEYGLYFLVFLLPWQTRLILRAGEINGGYFEYGSISLYALDLILVLVIILFAGQKVVEIKNTTENIKIKRIWFLLAGLELFIIISIFHSADKWLALYAYLRFLLGVGIFLLITSANYNRLKLYYSFLAGVFVQACLAIWQFVFQTSFANKWLGMAFHNPETLGTSVVELSNGERWLRAYGSLDHPNILGGYLCLGILLLIILKVYKKEKFFLKLQITNYKLIIEKYIFIFLYYFILTIFFIALFFTFSRSAWLSLSLGLGLLFIILFYKKDYLAQKVLLKNILFLGILFFLLFNQYNQLVSTRLSDSTRLEQRSNNERLESVGIAKGLIKNNFLFGVGIGNYSLAVHKEIDSGQNSWFYQPVHNLYLLVISEIGIFGGLCIIMIIWEILKLAYRQEGEKRVIFVTLLVTLTSLGMFDHWTWSLHFGVLLFWLILGIIYDNIQAKTV